MESGLEMPSQGDRNRSHLNLSHLNSLGEVHMVDVDGKAATLREAVAEGYLAVSSSALALVREGRAGKGDVLAVARVAAIQAAKRTADLIPLCHPLPLSGLTVAIAEAPLPDRSGWGLRCEASVRTTGPTGVEMEALTAVQVGLLTLYDMLKSVDRAMTIGPVRLLEKRGGRSGDWRHPAAPAPAAGDAGD
ncbi:MAG: cyclic pyranopterin monophosphate synthase MoaC [Chitinophagaceae bacterium]|jgi:cyclic pyranopterin phosphate synthase|nr:cyclic pyranopterin monophosphate synthase MoaC [Chitinophagaceae bacterium]